MLIFWDIKIYINNNISKGELLGTSRSGSIMCTNFVNISNFGLESKWTPIQQIHKEVDLHSAPERIFMKISDIFPSLRGCIFATSGRRIKYLVLGES